MSDYKSVPIDFPEVAANTDEAVYVTYPYKVGGIVDSIRLVPWTNRTADDTNYTDLSVELDGTEIASEQTTTGDTGDLVAGTDIAMALTAAGTSLEVGENSVFTFKKTDAGTGLAFDGQVVIRVKLDRLGAG